MGLELTTDDEWKTWDFDRDAAISNRRPIPTPDFRPERDQITREGLQTLLLLNLNTVFSGWTLRPAQLAGPPMDSAPIEAVDPAGTLHLFDLTDMRQSDTAISRGISRTLARFGRRNIDWLDTNSSEASALRLASRIAALWSDIEAEYDADSTYADDGRKQLQDLADRLDGGPSADELLQSSKRLMQRPTDGDDTSWPTRPTGIHLHLIVADSLELDEAELRFLKRLRDDGFRVDIWEIRLDIDRQWHRGTLGIRPAQFPDRNQRLFPALGDRRPTQLLAEMGLQRPDLRDALGDWTVIRNKRRTALRTELPIADEPCKGPFFSFMTRGDELEFKASLKIPEPVDDTFSLTDLKTRITPGTMEAVRRWIAEILPPDPAEYPEAARRLEHSLHQAKNWGGYLQIGDAGPVLMATGWHSGGFRSAKINVDTAEFSPSIEDLATLTNNVLELFLRLLDDQQLTPEGWSFPEPDHR